MVFSIESSAGITAIAWSDVRNIIILSSLTGLGELVGATGMLVSLACSLALGCYC